MRDVRCTAELLAPLTGLSSLHELQLRPVDRPSEGLEVVCQLTGLRSLHLTDQGVEEGQLRQLTQLQHLMKLFYVGPDAPRPIDLTSKVR